MIRNSAIAAITYDYEQHIQLADKFKMELETLPVGSLYSSTYNGKTSYYHYVPSGGPDTPPKKIYIKSNQQQLVMDLARKKFIEDSLVVLENNIRLLKVLLEGYNTYDSAVILQNLPKSYQGLDCSTTFGLLKTNSPCEWSNEPYDKNPINPEGLLCKSAYGLAVRSKSESIIASQMETNSIPFRYEALLQLEGQIFYPDFTILNPQDNRVIYWEHFGMVDDMEYAKKMNSKLMEYGRHGIYEGENLIITRETRKNPLSAQAIHRIIKTYLLPWK